ncbi:hypothetical protein M0R45_033223 [Rubus argutus]|uniref:Uncharacterized protein n=1 Tax=Rubus argutus TaxID=59490 RepID=A0AAW1WLW3_RUBAR
MGLSVFALLLVTLVAMMSLLQPSTSSSTNSTAAPWCNGLIDECLINAEAGDEGTDDVLDPMVEFSEISRRVLFQPKNSLVIPSLDGHNPVCGKSSGQSYKRCIAEHKNGGKTTNCKGTTYNRDC